MDIETRTRLAASYASVQAKIAELTEVKDGLREQLLEDGIGSFPAGPLKVQVTENRRLDAKTFEASYTAAEYPHLYELKPKPAAIRATLDADAIDQLFPSSGPVVKVL